jgi:alpha-tubulin suppressor-like RCC1 family protein
MLRWHPGESRRDFRMMHKGVEYTVAVTAVPSIWRWQFQIGETVKTGKTETKIDLLAIRRVQLRIDRELKKTTYNPAP